MAKQTQPTNDQTNPQQPPATPPTPPSPAKVREPSKGDKVLLVTVRDGLRPATVTAARGQTVDLVVDGLERPLVITSSPLDPTGTKPDHWTWRPADDSPADDSPADGSPADGNKGK